MSHSEESELPHKVPGERGRRFLSIANMALLGLGIGCLLVIGVQAIFGEDATCFDIKGCSSIVQGATALSRLYLHIPLWIWGILFYAMAAVLPFTKLHRWSPWISLAGSAAAIRVTVFAAMTGEYCPWTALPGILLLLCAILSLLNSRAEPGFGILPALGLTASIPLLASALLRPAILMPKVNHLEAADRAIVCGLADPKLDVSILWGSPWNLETLATLDTWFEQGKKAKKVLVYRFMPTTVYRQERLTAALLRACVRKGVLPKGAFGKGRQQSSALDALAANLGFSASRLLLEEADLTRDQGISVHLRLAQKGSHLIDCLPYEPCRLRSKSP